MQLADGGQGDVPVDEAKLHGKPDKTLRFSLCSDNLEGISEGEGSLWCLVCQTIFKGAFFIVTSVYFSLCCKRCDNLFIPLADLCGEHVLSPG